MQEDDVILRLGRNVRYLREKAGMTKGELARRLGIGPQGLSRLEMGIASSRIANSRILCRLCDIFVISSDSLLCDDLKQENE